MASRHQDVEKIAQLAKLEFSSEEQAAFVGHLTQIVSYVEKINELPLDEVEPTSHVLGLTNVFREDVVSPSLDQAEVLRNAPKHKNGYFSVPKVIANPEAHNG